MKPQPSTNSKLQVAYTALAPAIKITPPRAGPPITAAWMPAELKAVARGSMKAGTSRGVSACCAGIWKARAVPSAIDAPSSTSRDTTGTQRNHTSQTDDAARPASAGRLKPWDAPSNSSATASWSTRQAATMRPRCTRSATCPATSVNSNAGRNWYKPTRPKSQALPVSSYICQPTATSSIWLPVAPNRRANHMRMNARWRTRSEKESKGGNVRLMRGRVRQIKGFQAQTGGI